MRINKSLANSAFINQVRSKLERNRERGGAARRGYLRRTSLLYRPPYLLRCAASSVISGIQLANTAYTELRVSRPPPATLATRRAVCSSDREGKEGTRGDASGLADASRGRPGAQTAGPTSCRASVGVEPGKEGHDGDAATTDGPAGGAQRSERGASRRRNTSDGTEQARTGRGAGRTARVSSRAPAV